MAAVSVGRQKVAQHTRILEAQLADLQQKIRGHVQGAGAKSAPNDPRSHQEWNGGASGMVLG